MIKSHTVNWVVTLGALATAGAAITASQFINTASGGNSGSASSAKATPKPSKSPSAPEPSSKSLTVSGSMDVTSLVPGGTITRQLTIGNPNNQDVELQSVQTAVVGPSPAPTVGSCTSPADFQVIVAGFNASTGLGTPVTIKKNSSQTLPVTIRLNDDPTRNQNACKGRSWMFTFTATAASK